jgi:hypothetical protein
MLTLEALYVFSIQPIVVRRSFFCFTHGKHALMKQANSGGFLSEIKYDKRAALEK